MDVTGLGDMKSLLLIYCFRIQILRIFDKDISHCIFCQD